MTILQSLLQTGARLEISAHPFEVSYVGESSIRLSSEYGSTHRTLNFDAINELIDQNNIKVTYSPPTTHQDMFSALTDKQTDALNRKLNYVKGVCKNHANSRSQEKIAQTISDIADDINDKKKPSTSSVAGWIKQWVEGGYDRSVFIPRLKPGRSTIQKEDPSLLNIMRKAVQSIYLNRQKNPQTAVMAEIDFLLAEYNARHDTPLKTPSKEKLRRYINKLDSYEIAKSRHGKFYAKRKFSAAGINFFANEALELVMADGQVMDVILTRTHDDGTIEEIGRPYLTAFIDLRTRCVLGYYISLAPFCGATLLRALANCVVAVDGKPKGIFSKLLIDNGSDYQDSGFLKACAKLNIIVEPTKPREPNAKANIERFFRTLNTGLIHGLPGTTFSNPTDRGDYDSQDLARISLDDLRNHVQTWIDHIYHVKTHRALERAPIDVWNEEVIKCHPNTLAQQDADILLRDEVERTLTNGVVEAHGLQWKCQSLVTWEQSKRRLTQDRKVIVRVDELDLSEVFIATSDSPNNFHKALSRRPDYTRYLSLYEHKQIKEFTKIKRLTDRINRMNDKELYRLRLEYKASLGHGDDKIARRKLERLRDYETSQRLTHSETESKADTTSSKAVAHDVTESHSPVTQQNDTNDAERVSNKNNRSVKSSHKANKKPVSKFETITIKKRNPQ